MPDHPGSLHALDCSLVIILAGFAATASAQTKPNVVLIVMDDVGYGDYGSYGAPDIKTPNIDRLAQGRREVHRLLRRADVHADARRADHRALPAARGLEAPLPSRAGRRARTAADRPFAAAADEERRLRHRARRQVASRLPARYQPNAHGFDYFFGFLSGLVDYYQHTDQNGKPDLFENGTPVQVDGYMTDLITERSVKFIEQNAQRPFFLEVAYNAAHWPFQVPDKPSVAPDNARFVQPHEEHTSTRADYAAMLERADQGVGRIVDTLQKLGLSAQHARHLHQRQRRRVAVAQRAAVSPQGHAVGRRHPRAADHEVAGADSRRPHVAAGRHHDGSDDDDSRRDRARLFPPTRGSKASICCRSLTGRSPLASERCSSAITGARQQRAVRQGDWKLLLDGGDVLLFNLRDGHWRAHDLAKERPDIARACGR